MTIRAAETVKFGSAAGGIARIAGDCMTYRMCVFASECPAKALDK